MRFRGYLGYAEESVEDPPNSGIYKPSVVERLHSGDLIRDVREKENNSTINQRITLGNRISIVGDKYALAHLHELVYIRWNGHVWEVTSVETIPPRIIISVGGVYNGPTA
jgi:hypothetical protein